VVTPTSSPQSVGLEPRGVILTSVSFQGGILRTTDAVLATRALLPCRPELSRSHAAIHLCEGTTP